MADWVHENCGGEIIRITDEDGEFWECDKCQELWDSLDFFDLVRNDG